MEKQINEQVLDRLLKAYEQIGDKDFDTFLREQMNKLGLSEVQKQFFLESCKAIDDIDQKSDELHEAREQGKRREVWFGEQFNAATDNLKEKPTEEEKSEFLKKLSGAIEEQIPADDSK